MIKITKTNTIELAPVLGLYFKNMKTRIFSNVFSLILLMPLLAFAQNNIKGTVKGIDGKLISGVQVEIQQTFFKTYTNQEGTFVFSELESGDYVLNLSIVGYSPLSKIVQLANGDQEITIFLRLK